MPRAKRVRGCASARYEMVFNARESRITIISDASLSVRHSAVLSALFPPFPSLSSSFRSFRCCIDHLRCLDAYAKYIFYGRTQERLSTEPRGERETSDSRLKRTLITRPRSSSEYSRGPNQEFRDAPTFLERDAPRKSMDFVPPKIHHTRVLATSTRYDQWPE